MPYFFFEPGAPTAVHSLLPIPAAHLPMSYCYHPVGVRSGHLGVHWLIRDPKQSQWLPIFDEGVPETYRLEVLLLLAAYPN